MIWPLAAFFAGSVPTGVLLGRLAGRDPRAAGSGNIGASNVTRTLGKGFGALTLLVDVAKGGLPALLAGHFAHAGVAAAAGLAAVLGHCYTPWLKFNGGKGVATAFGAMLALDPVIAGLGALTWAFSLGLTRTPAIGSILAAALFVVLPHVTPHPLSLHLFSLAVFGVVVWRHRSNLKVLRQRWRAANAKRRRRFKPRRKSRGEPGGVSASGKPIASGNKVAGDKNRPRTRPKNGPAGKPVNRR
jgi:glycerol-3-phosphate acyltransferase PlsY